MTLLSTLVSYESPGMIIDIIGKKSRFPRPRSRSSGGGLTASPTTTSLSSFAFLTFVSCLQLYVIVALIFSANVVSASEVAELSANPQINRDLKNFKLLENKVIPDVSDILKNNNEKFETLRQFISSGWPTLEENGYKIDQVTPFTIIVPKVDIANIEKTRLKDVMLEHLVPGKVFDTFSEDEFYGNSNGHTIIFKTMKKQNESQWTLNGLKILRTIQINDKLASIFVDGFLGDRKAAFAKRNIQETNRYNEPQRLEMKNLTTKNEPLPGKDMKQNPLMTFLSSMKSGTKVFQHFLSKSNLTQTMDDGPSYTILIPSDNAFQRWHPIDWGFYPFSVQDFTESVLRNHFLRSQPLRMADVKNAPEMTFKTLGGETVIFKNNPSPNVNNVSILADYTLPNGNQVFIISEVLFVSEAVVSKLHQLHKDKETPPLLAFPWFGAQFLSHSFLALERDSRFTQITRYLNNAEVAPYVSGANYTFFVPIDEAFERIGFDLIPDDILASPKGVKMLLHHFVKGRLYDRDLKDGDILESIGGGTLKIHRKQIDNNVTVNNARIIESEVFVYNLGTMFYIDEILYPEILKEFAASPGLPSANGQGDGTPFEASGGNGFNNGGKGHGTVVATSTPGDVEIVPSEFAEQSGNDDDFLLHDEEGEEDEIVTPKALPVRFNFDPPK